MNAELLAVAKHLNDRGFLAEVVDTPEQAKQRILEYIGDRSVGIAGSATVRDLGLYEALTERGNQVFWHWKVEKPQVEQTRIAAIAADVHLCSTNAVTEDGRLVKETSYRMGVKEGRHIIFERNGDTAEVATWANNHRHGRWWKRLGQNGYITGNYVNGGLEGRLVAYDENGKLSREGFYSGGLKHGDYRYFEDGTLIIRERWNYGIMSDREILLPCPEPRWVSIHDIACMAAQGKAKTIVLLRDGTKLTAQMAYDPVFSRAGDELFSLANRKSHVSVARSCVQGVSKDSEGRDILLLEPQPDFTIFPDEDAIKMVQSIHYEEHSPLEEILNRQ